MTIKHQLFFEYPFNQHMKRELLHGHGVLGMCVKLSIMDMFAANQVAEELKAIVENHQLIERYKTTPYDKRKDAFPEGEPKRIEVSEKTLQNMHQLMLKLSYGVKSTLFDEKDEGDEEESTKDDDDAIPTNEKFCVQLIKVGPTKLQVVKAIKESTHLSLKESKELADAAEMQSCTIVAKGLNFSQATELKTRLLECGAVAAVILQSTIPQF